jgi:GTPase
MTVERQANGMKFLDQAKVYVRSGAGGAGAVSFRREKFIEFGGPTAATAGAAACLCRGVDGLNTLIDYRYQQHFKAGTGGHGMGQNRTGARAADVVLKLPVGTQIFEDDKETLIADLTEVGQRVMLRAAATAASATALQVLDQPGAAPRQSRPAAGGALDLAAAQADRRCRPRRAAQRRQVVAAGAVSAARPKIADYPFTTLHPAARRGERRQRISCSPTFPA